MATSFSGSGVYVDTGQMSSTGCLSFIPVVVLVSRRGTLPNSSFYKTGDNTGPWAREGPTTPPPLRVPVMPSHEHKFTPSFAKCCTGQPASKHSWVFKNFSIRLRSLYATSQPKIHKVYSKVTNSIHIKFQLKIDPWRIERRSFSHS